MRKIKRYLEQIRKPSKKLSYKRQIVITLGVILLGFLLGTLQKWIDGTGGSNLPLILQKLDIGNYFGRLAIWILLGTIISVYSESPVRAGINTFVFFISMLAGYYLYCNYVLGFLPRAYMMMLRLNACASKTPIITLDMIIAMNPSPLAYQQKYAMKNEAKAITIHIII